MNISTAVFGETDAKYERWIRDLVLRADAFGTSESKY